MDVKSKIDEAIEKFGIKHFTRSLKKDEELMLFLTNNADTSLPFVEQLSLFYHSETKACKYGNSKKFKGIQVGFGFCGRTGSCKCAQEVISEKVSQAKQSYSDEEKLLINNKREETNKEKYGVSNAGQTKKAKEAHSEFYQDAGKVKEAIVKYEETMLIKHGVRNGFQLPGPCEFRKSNNPLKDKTVRQKGIDIRKQKAKEGFYISISYQNIKERIETDLNVTFKTTLEDYKGVHDNAYYWFSCLKCNHEFETWLDNGHDPICKICNPTLVSYVSKEEKEVADWIESLGFGVDRHNKRLINPYEIDMIIHSKKLAIEYCGLYWHSQYRGGKDKDYHKNKMKRIEDKGYRCITIFSDEWNLKRESTKNVLQHILGISSKKIDARKCEVKIVPTTDEKVFFEEHHLQGWVSSQVAYGIYFEDELCGVMSFGPDRAFMNRAKKEDVYEIRRMAFKYNVRGGANKILKQFETDFKPLELWSDVDLRWSQGGIYTVLGMTEHKESAPNYWYVHGYSKRLHRFNFTKGRLIKEGYDPNKTEREIMQELGYDVIWDCGIKRFVKYY